MRKGTERAYGIAGRIMRSIDAFAPIEAPKNQFLTDVGKMYETLLNPPTKKPNDGIRHALFAMHFRQEGLSGKKEAWYNAREYPFLAGFLPGLKPVPETLKYRKRLLGVITPEVLTGVKIFLEQQGQQVASPNLPPNTSLSRRLAERYAGKKLQGLPLQVSQALDKAYSALPESSQGIANDVYALCEHITKLAGEGMDGQQITAALLKNLQPGNKEDDQ